jgi:hypothetical protein
MSRRVYLLGVGMALVALGLAFTDWALSLQPGVTKANVERIKPGMTLAEAEYLLGGPPRMAWYMGRSVRRPPFIGGWRGESGNALVWVDDSATVERVEWNRGRGAKPGLLARLRAWLGW